MNTHAVLYLHGLRRVVGKGRKQKNHNKKTMSAAEFGQATCYIAPKAYPVWGAVLLFISKMWYHLAFDVISPWLLCDITLELSDITNWTKWYHLIKRRPITQCLRTFGYAGEVTIFVLRSYTILTYELIKPSGDITRMKSVMDWLSMETSVNSYKWNLHRYKVAVFIWPSVKLHYNHNQFDKI